MGDRCGITVDVNAKYYGSFPLVSSFRLIEELDSNPKLRSNALSQYLVQTCALIPRQHAPLGGSGD